MRWDPRTNNKDSQGTDPVELSLLFRGARETEGTQVSMEVGQTVAREIQMGLASVTEAVSSCVQKSLQDSLVGTLVGAANAEITKSWARIASGDHISQEVFSQLLLIFIL